LEIFTKIFKKKLEDLIDDGNKGTDWIGNEHYDCCLKLVGASTYEESSEDKSNREEISEDDQSIQTSEEKEPMNAKEEENIMEENKIKEKMKEEKNIKEDKENIKKENESTKNPNKKTRSKGRKDQNMEIPNRVLRSNVSLSNTKQTESGFYRKQFNFEQARRGRKKNE